MDCVFDTGCDICGWEGYKGTLWEVTSGTGDADADVKVVEEGTAEGDNAES